MTTIVDDKLCDLVMEGGGVKGLGIIGALSVLSQHGWGVRRIAGTSAGAIVGSLAAAGMPIDSMRSEMAGLDYRKFRDEGMLDQFGPVGKAATLLLEKGIYKGDFARDWLSARLKSLNVVTFADIKAT